MARNMFQLNTDKTKCMIFGSPPQLRKLENSTFNAGGDSRVSVKCKKFGNYTGHYVLYNRSHHRNVHTGFLSTEKFIPH